MSDHAEYDADMARTTLRITYDGPALRDGTMEVRDLAPALLAMGRLLEDANRVVNGPKSQVAVRVTAGFKPGSFSVDLQTIQSFAAEIRDLLAGDTSTALANLWAHLGFFGLSGSGLFVLLRKLRGRRPEKATILKDGNVELVLPGGESHTIPKAVFDLLSDEGVRRSAAAVLEPLTKEGIDEFIARPAGAPKTDGVVITKEDLPSFAPPEVIQAPIVTNERRAAFSIVSLSFQDDNKWRLYDGRNTVWAKIEDQVFIKAVNEAEIAFSKGDVLICDIREEQYETTSGLRAEIIITKVVEHRRAFRQVPLPFDGPFDGAR
ncbi:hypothetical protein IBL25_03065 [Roseomonas ludipueritiae]|uniref:Uncharacterized protein n=1 Tax=Pseudoroseomonas ludipueritiae TaxID=198093 RepID=A0ABR7R2H2_9PROT|nr:hypothetical protein [Pseudoroseomonas ludipueritiae]